MRPCLCYTQYLTTNSQSPECSWARGQQRGKKEGEFGICGNGPWPLGGGGGGGGTGGEWGGGSGGRFGAGLRKKTDTVKRYKDIKRRQQ